MEILLWLVPSAVVTLLAMAWAAWAGRPQRVSDARSEADYERFVRAITAEHPAAGRPKPERARDRSTGIAVRPSRRSGTADQGATRRSA